MDEDFDPLGADAEEPPGLDHLQPLFMRVAESIVIFRPMVQVGWARASAGVTRSKVSRARVRNGPPEAVSNQAPDLVRAPAVQALVQRAVLAVDGQQLAAAGAGLTHHQLARHDQRLLVASATSFPAWRAR